VAGKRAGGRKKVREQRWREKKGGTMAGKKKSRKTLLWVASRVRLATQRPVESGLRDSSNPVRRTRLQARLTRLQAGQGPEQPIPFVKWD